MMAAFVAVHIEFRPYNESYLNHLEMWSLITSFMTLYGGLLYHWRTPRMTRKQKIFLQHISHRHTSAVPFRYCAESLIAHYAMRSPNSCFYKLFHSRMKGKYGDEGNGKKAGGQAWARRFCLPKVIIIMVSANSLGNHAKKSKLKGRALLRATARNMTRSFERVDAQKRQIYENRRKLLKQKIWSVQHRNRLHHAYTSTEISAAKERLLKSMDKEDPVEIRTVIEDVRGRSDPEVLAKTLATLVDNAESLLYKLESDCLSSLRSAIKVLEEAKDRQELEQKTKELSDALDTLIAADIVSKPLPNCKMTHASFWPQWSIWQNSEKAFSTCRESL